MSTENLSADDALVIETIDEFELVMGGRLSTTDTWRVAIHDPSVWSDDTEPSLMDVGDMVRVVVGEGFQSRIGALGKGMNPPALGQILPAVIVRKWNDRVMNLKVFCDGVLDFWVTSVDYHPVTIQEDDPEGEAGHVVHARGDTWHEEPIEYLAETQPDGSEVVRCQLCRAPNTVIGNPMTPVESVTQGFLGWWLCLFCGATKKDKTHPLA